MLKAILREAVRLGDITQSPAEDIPIPKKPQAIKQEVFIDKDDRNVLLDEIKGHILEELFVVTLFYGLRRSEVLGLKWSAIDIENS